MKQYRIYFRENNSLFSLSNLLAGDVKNTHVPITYVHVSSLDRIQSAMEPGRWCQAIEAMKLMRSKGLGGRYLGIQPGDVVQDIDKDDFYLLKLDNTWEALPR